MGFQTSVQVANAVKFGSGKIEISDDGVTYYDLGAADNVKAVVEPSPARIFVLNEPLPPPIAPQAFV